MDHINIGKTLCSFCPFSEAKIFDIYDIWETFTPDWDIDFKTSVDEDLNLKIIEKKAIKKAINRTELDKDAAKLLGITPRSLVYKKKIYKIEREK